MAERKTELQTDTKIVQSLEGGLSNLGNPVVTDFLAGYEVSPESAIKEYFKHAFKPKDGVGNTTLTEGFKYLSESLSHVTTAEERENLFRIGYRAEAGEVINPERRSFQWLATKFEGATEALQGLNVEVYDHFDELRSRPEEQLQVIDILKRMAAGTVASWAYNEVRNIKGQPRKVTELVGDIAYEAFGNLTKLEQEIMSRLPKDKVPSDAEERMLVNRVLRKIPLTVLTTSVALALMLSSCDSYTPSAPPNSSETEPRVTETTGVIPGEVKTQQAQNATPTSVGTQTFESSPTPKPTEVIPGYIPGTIPGFEGEEIITLSGGGTANTSKIKELGLIPVAENQVIIAERQTGNNGNYFAIPRLDVTGYFVYHEDGSREVRIAAYDETNSDEYVYAYSDGDKKIWQQVGVLPDYGDGTVPVVVVDRDSVTKAVYLDQEGNIVRTVEILFDSENSISVKVRANGTVDIQNGSTRIELNPNGVWEKQEGYRLENGRVQEYKEGEWRELGPPAGVSGEVFLNAENQPQLSINLDPEIFRISGEKLVVGKYEEGEWKIEPLELMATDAAIEKAIDPYLMVVTDNKDINDLGFLRRILEAKFMGLRLDVNEKGESDVTILYVFKGRAYRVKPAVIIVQPDPYSSDKRYDSRNISPEGLYNMLDIAERDYKSYYGVMLVTYLGMTDQVRPEGCDEFAEILDDEPGFRDYCNTILGNSQRIKTLPQVDALINPEAGLDIRGVIGQPIDWWSDARLKTLPGVNGQGMYELWPGIVFFR